MKNVLFGLCAVLCCAGLRAYDTFDAAIADGSAKLETKEYSAAGEAFSAALNMAADGGQRTKARMLLAESLLGAGDYEECRKVAEATMGDGSAASRWPGIQALQFIAESYLREKRVDEMNASIERIGSLAADANSSAWLRLKFASMQYVAKDVNGACETWDKIIQDPQAPPKFLSWAGYWLARAAKEHGNPDTAVETARKVLAYDQPDPAALAVTKKLLQELGAE